MFTELEFKYDAKDISWSEFERLMKTQELKDILVDSSWDVYYTKHDNSDDFQRFRMGQKQEITRKVKLKETNNNARIEVDLPLGQGATEEIVSKYVGLVGYELDFKIYKTYQVFLIGEINYSYYILYDENMKEKGRFIEVEVNKEAVREDPEWESPLLEGEVLLQQIGITPQNRKKKSLFEILRKTW